MSGALAGVALFLIGAACALVLGIVTVAACWAVEVLRRLLNNTLR
jgi:hypothetical protein